MVLAQHLCGDGLPQTSPDGVNFISSRPPNPHPLTTVVARGGGRLPMVEMIWL